MTHGLEDLRSERENTKSYVHLATERTAEDMYLSSEWRGENTREEELANKHDREKKSCIESGRERSSLETGTFYIFGLDC